MTLVTLRTSFSRPESEAVVSYLTSQGIPALAGERHHATINGDWLVALGGIRILVPEASADAAHRLLADQAESVDLWEGRAFRRHRFANTLALLCLFFGLGLVYFPYWIRSPRGSAIVETTS